jgi:hypothetical protein
MKPICAFIIIMAWLLLCGFGGRGMSKDTGIRGGDFNAINKSTVAEEPAGETYYILAEDSKVLTDESGNQLRTE